MNKDEFMKLINDIPKSNNPSPISTYGSVSVEDICNAIDRLNKAPTYDELLRENKKLNHYKLLYQKVKERNDDAIAFIKDTCIEQIPDMPKGCYREIASIGDLEELLEILKGEGNE